MSNWVDVVQGLIINPEDKTTVLMAFRPPNKKKPSMWEYPGGKVERGESLVDALRRELFEELAITAEIGECLGKCRFFWKENVMLSLYAIEYFSGTPQPLAATELKWVDPEHAIDWMPMLPGAFAMYVEVTSYLRRLK